MEGSRPSGWNGRERGRGSGEEVAERTGRGEKEQAHPKRESGRRVDEG